MEKKEKENNGIMRPSFILMRTYKVIIKAIDFFILNSKARLLKNKSQNYML